MVDMPRWGAVGVGTSPISTDFFTEERKENTMEVIIKVGAQKKMLRGGDRCFEVCELRNVRPEKGVEAVPTWVAFQWFVDLSAALTWFLREKVRDSDAKTLVDVKKAIEQAKDELMGYYDTNIKGA